METENWASLEACRDRELQNTPEDGILLHVPQLTCLISRRGNHLGPIGTEAVEA